MHSLEKKQINTNLDNILKEIGMNISKLGKYSFFKIAIVVQIGYIIVALSLFFTVFYSTNDFTVFYDAGNRVIFNIDKLYFRENNDFFFRYLPLSALIYTPFSLLGFNVSYITFMFFNLALNVGICIYIYKIITLINTNRNACDERMARYISLFLGASPQVNNYILGQNNLIVIFLILMAIFLFIKHNSIQGDFLGSFLIGISICVKPIAFLAVPFLLIMNYEVKERKIRLDVKKSLMRTVGALLFLLPNVAVFYLKPALWDGFLSNNFAGGNIIEIKHSFSLTKLILNGFTFFNIPVNQTIIFLSLLFLIGITGFLFYILDNTNRKSILYGLSLGMLVLLLVYYDTWDHHLLIIIPLFILIIFDIPNDSKIAKNYLKPSLYFFVFIDLIFMGIWYLMKAWFPFNFPPTIFLMLSFYGIIKFISSEKQKNLDENI
ncbi:MAG: DUF2029 domain-containing protein [Candidatus Lokiarchaeota archaeon]|nr:DUF2029 domain-containing protein [Candidatus Lokiarchaeota archaeon]